MPIGNITNEGELARFIEDRIPDYGALIRTLRANVRTGTGSPEGEVEAIVGTLYLRRDGGAGTTLYVKESGTGDTGWAANG